MRRATLLFCVLVLAGIALGQGTPHSIVGSARNSDASDIPIGCGAFIAYPYPFATDTITEGTDVCGFAGSNWWVQIADLNIADGETVAIRLENTCNGETLLILVEVDLGVPTQDVGIVTLGPGVSTITVNYPDGGESFQFGDNTNILWYASTGIATVDIYFSSNGGGGWDPVAAGVNAALGTLPWTVPAVESDQCLIRIEDSGDPLVFDLSDALFEISPTPSINMTQPVGGELYYVGDSIDIGWCVVGVTQVDVYFSSNGGGNWALIEDSINTGACAFIDWIAPDSISSNCMIRVWDTDDHGLFDVSGLFTIDTPAVIDTIPPAAVVNLDVDSTTFTDVLLSWTITGDDGLLGIPSAIDLRFNVDPITDVNWAGSTPIGGLPAPDTSGTDQQVWAFGFVPGGTYYFAMKVGDEAPNWSGLSNVVGVTLPQPPDTIAPGAFTLTADDIECHDVTISWNAPGDDVNVGTADRYAFRCAEYELTELNFNTGIIIDGVPAPLLAGSPQEFVLDGLAMETQYWVAAYAYDEMDNSSPFTVVDFTTIYCDDVTPPAQINFISCVDFRPNELQISWIAPGDDGFTGQATSYEVRYSTEYFDEETWVDVPACTLSMIPQMPGETEYAWIGGLDSPQGYYFAVFAFDDVQNRSYMGALTYCTTMGIENPVNDISTLENAPDFFLVNMADVFIPDGLNLWAESGEGIVLYDPDSMKSASDVWVHLDADWWGDSYIIIFAEHGGYILCDTILVHVGSVNDAPYFTNDMPDSAAVPGLDFEFTFTADDVDGDSVKFFLSESPIGMLISDDGELFWSPPPTEGHYDVTVGVTDGQDSAYFGFPVRVFKLTDTVFAPRNLAAHSGFAGSIPLNWDTPDAVLMDFPVNLIGYQVFRSEYPDSEPSMIGTSDVNTYNDISVICGQMQYYRVRAVYDVPSFVSAYSNIDDGLCEDGSERVYSAWTIMPVVVDGQLDDEAWNLATVVELVEGYTLRFVNTASYLYGFVEFMELPEPDQEFSFWFDDDNSGWWDNIPSDEGRIFFLYDDVAAGYFQPVADIFGAPSPGTASEMSTVASVWLVDGSRVLLEFSIPLGDDDHFGALPGDSSGIMLAAENSLGTIFQWLSTSVELAPATYGRLVLGSPGGVPSILVTPTSFEFTLEQGLSTRTNVSVQNLGEGTGFFSLSGMPDWISAEPISGLLYPGIAQQIEVNVTALMEPGDYIGYINVYTTDPVNPLQQVEITLHITAMNPENYLEIALPSVVYVDAGEEVVIPLSIGELYENDITRIQFTVSNAADVAVLLGAMAGSALPGGWELETVSIDDDHITVDIHGDDPLTVSGELLELRYEVPVEAMDGAATALAFSGAVVNDGFPYPLTSDGFLVVGDGVVPYWSAMVVLVMEGEVRADSANFGVHPLASNAYDLTIDMPDPPSFPDGGNVFFLSDNGYELVRDLRHLGDTLIVFTLVTEDAGRIEWDTNQVWSGCFVGDTLDMKNACAVDVEIGDTVLIYYHYSPEFQITIHLKAGWNMVSIPIDADSFELTEIFPGALYPAYYYDPLSESYIPTPILLPGKGYWVLVITDNDYVLSGEPLLEYELQMSPGWSMVGAAAQTAYWDEQVTVPADALLPGTLFGYDAEISSYYIATALSPGVGYWAMSLETCILKVSIIYGGH